MDLVNNTMTDEDILKLATEIVDMARDMPRLDAIYEAAHEIRRQLNQNDWQPIETAPKDGTIIILPNMVGTNTTLGRWGTYMCNVTGWYDMQVGHLNGLWKPEVWMPCPPVPNKTK